MGTETPAPTNPGRCFLCGRQLSADPSEVYMGIDEDAMARQGILENSEIRQESRVFVLLCAACGFPEGLPSVQEIRDTCETDERHQPKQ
jgi:hypothetical protein